MSVPKISSSCGPTQFMRQYECSCQSNIHMLTFSESVKEQLFLCVTSIIPWRRIAEMEISLHAFLASALDGDELSASCLGHFIRGKSPRYPLDKRLGGPQSRSWCGGEEKKIPLLTLPETEPRPSIP